ncbi:hypothetical protein [Halobacillus karajensis]|uniref:Uncharacterized protein n=2 Tax=Halobacillus karajensis TaxID=195088 RepID=A0A024P9W3_9BACI|nr:hypothetical protein [Halobacillus karajensis]CDQ21292.1 hypothetical protein BN982_03659 [Halobacillus karajensis]CDQ25638.1 hypothetical protein BN983_03994 [Halobacillus karajensis]CDQ25909.1 hypothetical protein BN981_00115 [Halobacillus karajensis]
MIETENGVYLLIRMVSIEGNQLTYYQVKGNNLQKLGENAFAVKGSEEVRDIQFTVKNNMYHILVSTLQKQSQSGEVENDYYYAEGPFEEDPNLNRLSFSDPFSSTELREVSDLSMEYTEDGTLLLFKATGWTETRFRENTQFNIYQAKIKNNNETEVTRLSNTPSFSNFPIRVNPDTIIWVDHGGENHNLLVSSSRPEVITKADQVTKQALLHTSGKTIGMLSAGLFALLISIIWFLWPLLFMIIIMFTRVEAMDQDRSWVLYTGIFIYLIAAIWTKDLLFSESLLSRAPEYLSFPGSPILYLLSFGLISFAMLKIGSPTKDWSIPVQLTYFIGVHVLLITVIFGPYLL